MMNFGNCSTRDPKELVFMKTVVVGTKYDNCDSCNSSIVKKLKDELVAAKRVEDENNQLIQDLQMHIKYLEGQIDAYESMIPSIKDRRDFVRD